MERESLWWANSSSSTLAENPRAVAGFAGSAVIRLPPARVTSSARKAAPSKRRSFSTASKAASSAFKWRLTPSSIASFAWRSPTDRITQRSRSPRASFSRQRRHSSRVEAKVLPICRDQLAALNRERSRTQRRW